MLTFKFNYDEKSLPAPRLKLNFLLGVGRYLAMLLECVSLFLRLSSDRMLMLRCHLVVTMTTRMTASKLSQSVHVAKSRCAPASNTATDPLWKRALVAWVSNWKSHNGLCWWNVRPTTEFRDDWIIFETAEKIATEVLCLRMISLKKCLMLIVWRILWCLTM